MGFKLGNIDVDKIYLGSTEITKAYIGTQEVLNEVPVDSNLILNGTFDNADNLTVPATWNLTGGTANYTRAGEDFFILELSENITIGDTIELTFDISNTTLSGARLRVHISDVGAEYIAEMAMYQNGNHTVTHTITTDTSDKISIRGSNSGGGGEFSLDNVTLIKTN